VSNFVLVTEAELTRARREPAFRHQLLATNLERLLKALHQLRNCPMPSQSTQAGQIREGARLAVRLAEMLHADAERAGHPPHAA
jgi:hypothetical protein